MRILKETADIIHNCLQTSLNDSQTKALLDLLDNFREDLKSASPNVPAENRLNYYRFVDGTRASHYYHLKRSEITSFARNFSITLAYLLLWQMEQCGLDVDRAELLGRFKALISDLRKNLDKSFESSNHSAHEKEIEELSSNVRDRVGFRMVVDTSDSNLLFTIWTTITDVLGGFNPLTKDEFTEWYKNNPRITASQKRAIREILNVPVSVGKYKNYVDFPKANNYQSLQGTFTIQFYSNVLPGLQFELQLRTKQMDEMAVNGSAAHQVYKKNKTVHQIIRVADPTVLLRLKKGLDDFIPLCHCLVNHSGVEVVD